MKKLSLATIVGIVVVSLIPIVSLGAGFFHVDSNGNIGVGNTNPQHKMDVSGSIYSRLTTTPSSSIDLNNGNIQTLNLTSNSTISFVNGQAGGEYKLIIKQDATGGRTITWPSTIKWQGGIAPILTGVANSMDLVSFIYDGTNYLGSYGLNYRVSSSSIAFDTKTTSQQLNASSITWSHTTGGSNRILFVVTEGQNNCGANSVTYNGTSLTQIQSNISGGNSDISSLWYLVNPSAGSNNVVINRGCGSGWFGGAAVSYTGVHQSNPINASGTSTGSGTSASKSLTTTVDNTWGFLVALATATKTASTNATQIYNDFNDHTSVYDNSGVAPFTSSGSYTMASSLSSSDSWSTIMVAFTPAN